MIGVENIVYNVSYSCDYYGSAAAKHNEEYECYRGVEIYIYAFLNG